MSTTRNIDINSNTWLRLATLALASFARGIDATLQIAPPPLSPPRPEGNAP